MANGVPEPYFEQRMQQRQWEMKFPQEVQRTRAHGKLKMLGTRKQKENKEGNTGRKVVSDILEKREDQNP